MAAEGEEAQKLTAPEALLQLLREKAPAQMGAPEMPLDGGGNDDDEDGDHDNELMDCVADLVGGYAKALGPQFSSVSAEVVDAMMKFSKAVRHAHFSKPWQSCLSKLLRTSSSFQNTSSPGPLILSL